jgi:hypothetical protein
MDDGGCPVTEHRWMMASREHRRARASHRAQSTFPLAARGAACLMVSMMAMRLLCRLGSAHLNYRSPFSGWRRPIRHDTRPRKLDHLQGFTW